jgi:hypothetical protein
LDRITAVGIGNLDDEARAELLCYSQASQRVYRRHRESFQSWSGISQGSATAGMKSTARHVSSKPIDGGGLLDLFDDIAGTGGSFKFASPTEAGFLLAWLCVVSGIVLTMFVRETGPLKRAASGIEAVGQNPSESVSHTDA